MQPIEIFERCRAQGLGAWVHRGEKLCRELGFSRQAIQKAKMEVRDGRRSVLPRTGKAI